MTAHAAPAPGDELAELFIATVQGDFSPDSCAVVNGALVRADRPIPRAAQPDLALLSKLLRSPSPLPERIETWVIELFNQQGDSACRVKEIRRRTVGRPWATRFVSWFDSLPADILDAARQVRSPLVDAGCISDFDALYFALADRRPLSARARTWLADIFSSKSRFDFQVRTIVRRTRGAKPIGLNATWFGWEAARKVEALLKETYWEAAIAQVAGEYGKRPSYIEHAVQFRRIAKKVGAAVP